MTATIQELKFGYASFIDSSELSPFPSLIGDVLGIQDSAYHNLQVNVDTLKGGRLKVSLLEGAQNFQNPFRAEFRLSPISFTAPIERRINLRIPIPAGYRYAGSLRSYDVGLPGDGGAFRKSIETVGDELIINTLISLERMRYMQEEYPYIRKLFSLVEESFSEELIFERVDQSSRP